jgi:TolB protein
MRFLIFFIFSISLFANVDATIRIEKDVDQRSKIALIDESSGVEPYLSSKFFKILQDDLKIAGNFVTDKTHYLGMEAPSSEGKDYILKYRFNASSGASLDIKLIKAASNELIFSKNYNIGSMNKYPFLAHQAISDINDQIGYPSISWINRYVVYSRYSGAKQSQIILADYTMTYQKVMISGGLNLFPKWGDKEQNTIYYTSYNGSLPTLFKLNIYSGAKQRVASSEGMMVCSDVSADGSKILVTMAPSGQPDIYEIDVTSGVKNRLTTFSGIDVNGKYVDGGSSIVYISNPLGYANVYKKPLFGSAVNQLVFHGRNNNSCDSSGRNIVYSSRESSNKYSGNRFNIYLASSSGGETRPLTTTGNNQFPRFSSDGAIVMYIKYRGNSSSIGYINLNKRKTLLFPIAGNKVQSIDW